LSFAYTVSEEEFELMDSRERTCEGCPHFDDLNRYCWLAWKDRDPEDACVWSVYLDTEGTPFARESQISQQVRTDEK